MVVDRNILTADLTKFYDFRGKAVLYVGAGGGQLLSPTSGVREIAAVDSNPASLEAFRREAKTRWAGIPVRFFPQDFAEVEEPADVTYFEFCLHEMKDPRRALDHARSLGPDIVVMDHLPQSEWMFYGAEEADALRSSKAAESFGIKRRQTSMAEQRFKDYDELATRLSGQGEVSHQRILGMKGTTDIRIRMDYGLFLL